MVIGLALLVLYETFGVPPEIVIGILLAIAGWFGKSGLEAWKRRVKKGKEQFEVSQVAKTLSASGANRLKAAAALRQQKSSKSGK